MSVFFTFDPDERLLTTLVRGVLTDESLSRCMQLSSREVPDSQSCLELIDFQQVDGVAATAEALTGFFQIPSAASPVPRREKRAVVASGDTLFGMVRIFEGIHTAPHALVPLKTFRTVEDARLWLFS